MRLLQRVWLCMPCTQALGQLCAEGQLPAASLQHVASRLLDILTQHAQSGNGHPEESAPASRLVFVTLRTLQTVLSQVRCDERGALSYTKCIPTGPHALCPIACVSAAGQGGARPEPGVTCGLPEVGLGLRHPAAHCSALHASSPCTV